MTDMDLKQQIDEYYKGRQLKYPSFDEALKFVHTELAEIYELDLSRIGGWTRNNPQNKPKFTKEALSEELGDAIFMLLMAGYAEDVDPLSSMKDKMARKLKEAQAKKEPQKVAYFVSDGVVLSEQQAEELITHGIQYTGGGSAFTAGSPPIEYENGN